MNEELCKPVFNPSVLLSCEPARAFKPAKDAKLLIMLLLRPIFDSEDRAFKSANEMLGEPLPPNVRLVFKLLTPWRKLLR